jgi:hypothetical protein
MNVFASLIAKRFIDASPGSMPRLEGQLLRIFIGNMAIQKSADYI